MERRGRKGSERLLPVIGKPSMMRDSDEEEEEEEQDAPPAKTQKLMGDAMK